VAIFCTANGYKKAVQKIFYVISTLVATFFLVVPQIPKTMSQHFKHVHVAKINVCNEFPFVAAHLHI
jgi:hypothetical protein